MYHALIRTHHITSRKKVSQLKAAAKKLQCYALLRSGGIPGVMFVQGESREAVQSWVDTVHQLRYKDYQLVSDVSPATETVAASAGVLDEVSTVKELGAKMDAAGLTEWWRTAMGFVNT